LTATKREAKACMKNDGAPLINGRCD